MADRPAQSELQCRNCSGQQVYSPEKGALECLQCGEVAEMVVSDTAIFAAGSEQDYPAPETPPTEMTAQTHQCETCGGQVIFTGPVLSQRCAYCDGPVVLRMSTSGYDAMALIPFAVTEDAAQAFAQNWVGRRIAAPDDLAGIVAQARVAGLFAPFWTFDSEEAIEYTAKYKVQRGKKTITKTTSGAMRTEFDDMLAPASHHITPLIRDGILHDFNPDDLRPYRPGFLSGFAAERHHQTVSEGLASLAADKDLLIRNRIKTHINKSRVHDIVYRTDTTGIRYRRILLPVWMLHYEYQGEPMKVVVCGMQGRAFGERPFSYRKLLGYSAVLSALAIAAGLLWGIVAAP